MTTVANRFAVFLCAVMLAAMALACLTAGAFAADPPVATDGRVVGDESRTRFVLDLSG